MTDRNRWWERERKKSVLLAHLNNDDDDDDDDYKHTNETMLAKQQELVILKYFSYITLVHLTSLKNWDFCYLSLCSAIFDCLTVQFVPLLFCKKLKIFS